MLSTRLRLPSFRRVGRRTRNDGTHEFEMQQWIMEAFGRQGLQDLRSAKCQRQRAHMLAIRTTEFHTSSHFHTDSPRADFVMLDIWAKRVEPGSVYYDITWTGVVGTPNEKQREIFEIVRGARDTGIRTVQEAFAAKKKIHGWEVDKATREFIDGKGWGKYFVHRTGHSITGDIHGNGANLDNLETKDDREILPNTCFSVEPGIYLPEFGVRSEINMMIRNGKGEVTGRIQNELVQI